MYNIKLLLISQLLLLSCAWSWADSHDAIADVESLEDAHESLAPTTTTLPEIMLEENGTVQPESALHQLDEGLALVRTVNSVPETTIQPIETTSEPTTTPTTTTTTTEGNPQKLPPPQGYRFAHSGPYPGPYPGLHAGSYPVVYPGPYPYPQAGPAAPKTKPDSSSEPSYPGYPYSSYPATLRSPYSPYSPYGPPPHFHQPGYSTQFPGFAPPGPPASPEMPKPKQDDGKADDATSTDKSMMKPTEEQPEQPNFGYPPVYVIQRRPQQLPIYPYGAPGRGYASPYGYGRY